MTLSIDLVLYLIAAILFGLAGFKVQDDRFNWQALAFMVLVISLIV